MSTACPLTAFCSVEDDAIANVDIAHSDKQGHADHRRCGTMDDAGCLLQRS